jgi:hypothetical protein
MALVTSYTNGARAIVRLTSNATLHIPFTPAVGNTAAVNSDIANPNTEPVTGANIAQLWFATAGTITISRDGQTLFNLKGTDHWNFREGGFTMTELADKDVTISFSDAASTLIIEFAKLRPETYE